MADAPPPASQVEDIPILRALGNRRSIRYFDADKTVEDWKIESMLQAARFASCQGNINCTEAIVVTKDSEYWEDIEECVSGFNVQIINQSSHLILWLTNLNAWYGRAVDGISTVSLSGATTKYHGWNYEFSMTQTIPRLMSFPTERTENLLRFETGQAAANAMAAAVGLGVGNILIAFGRKPGGIEKAFGLPPHYRFTWGHAVGYPLENANAGGQRPRLKFEKLFHDNAFGTPLKSNPETVRFLRDKGLIQEQAPIPGRVEEIQKIANDHGRDPGMLFFPKREVERLMNDDDWDFESNWLDYAKKVVETEELPDYPEEMRETFKKLMAEHGIDAKKFLPAED